MVTVRSSAPNLVTQLTGLEVFVRTNSINLEHETGLQLQRVRITLQAVALDALDDFVRRSGTLFKHGLPRVPDRPPMGVGKALQRVHVYGVATDDSVAFAVALKEALWRRNVKFFRLPELMENLFASHTA